jgi:hypothetical protein
MQEEDTFHFFTFIKQSFSVMWKKYLIREIYPLLSLLDLFFLLENEFLHHLPHIGNMIRGFSWCQVTYLAKIHFSFLKI